MRLAHKVGIGGGAAAVIACCMTLTPSWEGLWTTAKVDRIGTGHPVTYCFGQTDEFGKVKAGTHFTPTKCSELLAESLPKYLAKLDQCVKVKLPNKVYGALLDAAYNAGPAAVCRSPMVKKANAGDLWGACNAFAGWYIRASGRVVKGLINRRNAERKLCFEGLKET